MLDAKRQAPSRGRCSSFIWIAIDFSLCWVDCCYEMFTSKSCLAGVVSDLQQVRFDAERQAHPVLAGAATLSGSQ